MAPSSSFVDGTFGPIAIFEWGTEGDPILLVHPTGFHARVWDPVAELLVDAGHRVVAFDVTGHGDSAAPAVEEFDYAWPALVADVRAAVAVESPDGRPIVAAGHSMGGALLALAEVADPGTFASLWLYEPILFSGPTVTEPQPDFFLAVGARRRRNRWPSIDVAYEAYASKPPLDALRPDVLRAYVEHGLRRCSDESFELKCAPSIEAQHYAIAPMNGMWSRLPEITVPTRVLCGANSSSIPPLLAQRIVDAMPKASLDVWDDHGHFGPLADPERMARSILEVASAADGSAAAR